MKQARALRVPEVCVHILCANTLCSLALLLSLVLAFVHLCSLMEEHQNVQVVYLAPSELQSLLLHGQLILCTHNLPSSYNMMFPVSNVCAVHWSSTLGD